jgi:hypothetical protein
VSAPEPSSAFAERLGMVIGIVLAANMSFMTAAPYLIPITPVAQRLIDQQQTILQSIFMVLVGYLWGNSAGNKSKDSAIHAQADAAKAIAQAAVPPIPSIGVGPGEHVTVEGKE